MPRLTVAQKAVLAAQDAEITTAMNKWQALIDQGDLDVAQTCMNLMGDLLKNMYPSRLAQDPAIHDTYLADLYPGVKDPELVFHVVFKRFATMDQSEFDTLLREPVFAFYIDGGAYDRWGSLSSINNYFGMLHATREHHRYWIDVYMKRYAELSKPLKITPLKGFQRDALMFAFATGLFIACCPHIFQEPFYRYALHILDPAQTVHEAELMSHFGVEGRYDDEPGDSKARGLAEIELLSSMIQGFFTSYPDVLERIQAGN